MCLRLLLPCVIALMIPSVGAGQQLEAVSKVLSPRLDASTRKTVAVVDFTDLQGAATELGRYLAEELSVMLAGAGKNFTVVDRAHLRAILQEHKLNASGLIDPQTARQLGKIAGVDTLVAGTLTPFGDSVRLTVKLLDAQTAGMLAATTADIPRTKAIDELLGRSLAAPAANSPVAPQPASSESQRVQSVGVMLELVGCRKSGECQLFVVANEDMRFEFTAGLRSAVRAWDQSGNEYEAKMIRIGNRESFADLVAGVRTPVSVYFEFSTRANRGIGSGLRGTSQSGTGEVSSLSAIEAAIAGLGRNRATVRFRNVAVK
jgi:TolB-like protein